MNNLPNFKSYFKFLSRNKVFTVINVFGLSVSLMFVILIMVYVGQGLSTDRFQKNADRVFVIGSEEGIGFAWRIGEKVAGRYPEIEKMCPVVSEPDMPVFIGDKKFKANLLITDTTFFDMFTFPLLSGDPHTVIAAKNYAVISESFARHSFGDHDPLGQLIKLNDSLTVTVNGVMKDIKNSTIPSSDIIIKMDNVRFFNMSLDTDGGDNSIGIQVFFQAVAGADLQARSEDIAEYLKEIFWLYKNGHREKVVFTPLKEIYFYGKGSHNTLLQNNWLFVVLFMVVGILILIFAVINYINLTVAQTGQRAKEMATRRLLGSSRAELFMRLIAESSIICIISFIFGLLLAFAALPFAEDLLNTTIDLKGFFTVGNSLVVLLMIIAVGFISGLLPAIIISNSKPIDIVRGGFRTKTKMVFSKVFITFQNVITIMLLAASTTMILQINHMVKAPLGYNTANMMYVPTYQFESDEKIKTFVNEVRQLASVKRVAYSRGTPFTRGNNNTVVYEGRNISFQWLGGDSTYFDMLGFEVIHKNNVSGSQYFMNEQALLELELPPDATEVKIQNHVFPIAGVIRDFQLGNILHKKQPVIVEIFSNSDFYAWNVLIETQGDPYVARDQVKKIYEDISQLDFTGKYTDEQVEESYVEHTRMAKLVIVFAVIAVFISLLGLLAMSTYFIQQRSREVSVRKVFGSSNKEILTKLIATFLNYVLIAFVIATPVVWYIMKKWLSDFSYRISLYPWIFIVAGLFCLVVAFITVFFQSWRAANANPVENIKTE
ncbi:MAG: FtsX-like permease family protein [Tannerella sp.]|jgi:putative ABC transport system permease protein|nr:FtsX-like permease family protein [Tannerella sp.]